MGTGQLIRFAPVGIQDASFHSVRRTEAGWLVMEGVDRNSAGWILGLQPTDSVPVSVEGILFPIAESNSVVKNTIAITTFSV
jgi:hypothetical protein